MTFVPVGVVLLAFLEEACDLVTCLLAIERVDVENRNLINNDFYWSSLICCKGWKPSVHFLHDCQFE